MVSVPSVIGHVAPIILMPIGVLAGMSPDQVRFIFAHELAHIRRHDYLVGLGQALIESLLFYHPAAWWVSQRVRQEREHCCDDLAVSVCGDVTEYAEALARLEELRPSELTLAPAATGGALLPRIRRLLGAGGTGHHAKLGAALVCLALAGVLSLVIVGALATWPVFHVSGDNLDVQLIGVQADGADAMFDPQGSPLPKPLLPHMTMHQWTSDHLQRDFVLKMPAATQPTLVLSIPELRESSSGSRLSGGFSALPPIGEQPMTAALSSTFRADYSTRRAILFRVTKPVEHVDLTLRYFQGPPRPARFRFTGPLTVGKTIPADAGRQGQITISPPNARSPERIGFTFTTPEVMTDGFVHVLVYDDRGDRHLAGRGNRRSGAGGTVSEYHIEGIALDRIAAIAIGEPAQERTFHWVRVAYPGRPRHTYPPYFDAIAARLGMNPGSAASLAQRQFTPREAVRIIDLARGDMTDRCWRAIQNREPRLRVEDLTDEERERVRGTALKAIQDPSTKPFGALLGLWGNWPEFGDPALDTIVPGGPAAGEVVFLFVNRPAMRTTANRQRIKDILIARGDRRTDHHLLSTLHPAWLNAEGRHEGSGDSVPELVELAQRQELRLWWPAISLLGDTSVGKSFILKMEKNPAMCRRIIQVFGPARTPNAMPDMVTHANAELPGLLSIEVLRTLPDRWNEIAEAIGKRADPAQATPAIIEFLRQLQRDPNSTASGSFSTPNEYAVIRLAQILNGWHQINIGALGKPGDKANDIGFDWSAVVSEALYWSKTRNDPSKLAAEWTAGPNDLRIIFRSLDAPELSLIGIAERRSFDDGMAPWNAMQLVRDFVHYGVEPTEADGRASHHIHFRLGVVHSNGGTLDFKLRPDELPKNLGISGTLDNVSNGNAHGGQQPHPRWLGRWEVWVESAQAEASVLKGTEVYDAWRQRYATGQPADAPLTRVFAQHRRDAIRQMLINRAAAQPRRSEDGWTPIQLALLEPMSHDPSHWDEDLRLYADPPPPEETIAAWERFLKRDDLPVEVRIHALFRVGYLRGQLRASRLPNEQNAAKEQAMNAYREILRLAPEAVMDETVFAMVNLSSQASGDPSSLVERKATLYRWLCTRTDAMLRDNVNRSTVVQRRGGLTATRFSIASLSSLTSRSAVGPMPVSTSWAAWANIGVACSRS